MSGLAIGRVRSVNGQAQGQAKQQAQSIQQLHSSTPGLAEKPREYNQLHRNFAQLLSFRFSGVESVCQLAGERHLSLWQASK